MTFIGVNYVTMYIQLAECTRMHSGSSSHIRPLIVIVQMAYRYYIPLQHPCAFAQRWSHFESFEVLHKSTQISASKIL